jgi:CRP-like cAMP-binding protein
MAKVDATDQLRKVPLFSGLDKKELEMLSKVAKEQRYSAGSTIVKTGAAGHGLYIIKDGHVSVRKQGKTVNRLGPGNFFGEIAVLDGGPRTADVVADTDTSCLTLISWEVKPLLMEQSSMAYKMLLQMVQRLREASPELPASA